MQHINTILERLHTDVRNLQISNAIESFHANVYFEANTYITSKSIKKKFNHFVFFNIVKKMVCFNPFIFFNLIFKQVFKKKLHLSSHFMRHGSYSV